MCCKDAYFPYYKYRGAARGSTQGTTEFTNFRMTLNLSKKLESGMLIVPEDYDGFMRDLKAILNNQGTLPEWFSWSNVVPNHVNEQQFLTLPSKCFIAIPDGDNKYDIVLWAPCNIAPLKVGTAVQELMSHYRIDIPQYATYTTWEHGNVAMRVTKEYIEMGCNPEYIERLQEIPQHVENLDWVNSVRWSLQVTGGGGFDVCIPGYAQMWLSELYMTFTLPPNITTYDFFANFLKDLSTRPHDNRADKEKAADDGKTFLKNVIEDLEHRGTIRKTALTYIAPDKAKSLVIITPRDLNKETEEIQKHDGTRDTACQKE